MKSCLGILEPLDLPRFRQASSLTPVEASSRVPPPMESQRTSCFCSRLATPNHLANGLGQSRAQNHTVNGSAWRLVASDSTGEAEMRPTNCLVEAQAAPLSDAEVPIQELARRKVVWVWICCCCGHGGMKVSVDPCPRCGVPRCPSCDTQRINTRGP